MNKPNSIIKIQKQDLAKLNNDTHLIQRGLSDIGIYNEYDEEKIIALFAEAEFDECIDYCNRIHPFKKREIRKYTDRMLCLSNHKFEAKGYENVCFFAACSWIWKCLKSLEDYEEWDLLCYEGSALKIYDVSSNNNKEYFYQEFLKLYLYFRIKNCGLIKVKGKYPYLATILEDRDSVLGSAKYNQTEMGKIILKFIENPINPSYSDRFLDLILICLIVFLDFFHQLDEAIKNGEKLKMRKKIFNPNFEIDSQEQNPHFTNWYYIANDLHMIVQKQNYKENGQSEMGWFDPFTKRLSDVIESLDLDGIIYDKKNIRSIISEQFDWQHLTYSI